MKSSIARMLLSAAVLVMGIGAAAMDVVDIDHRWMDGLYSTITVPSCTGGVKPKHATWLGVRVPGFRDALYVKAVIQPNPAPLVVILVGSFGNADGASANLWMSWLEKKGYHALSFDSTLNPRFITAARAGVPGHPGIDAEVSVRVIDAARVTKELNQKVTRISVVGISFGATQALHMAKLAREGKLPFQIEAVQAYNPPVSLSESLCYLDNACTYQWKMTDHYWAFDGLKREYPVKQTFDPRMMEAALGRVFRDALAATVDRSDEHFRKDLDAAGAPRLLPEKGGMDNRESYAQAVSFQEYMDNLVVPFWVSKGRIQGKADLVAAGELSNLLGQVDQRVEVILTLNDPLNRAGAAEAIKAHTWPARVTLLARGGHLGYVNAEWTQKNLTAIFDPTWVADGPGATKDASGETSVPVNHPQPARHYSTPRPQKPRRAQRAE